MPIAEYKIPLYSLLPDYITLVFVVIADTKIHQIGNFLDSQSTRGVKNLLFGNSQKYGSS